MCFKLPRSYSANYWSIHSSSFLVVLIGSSILLQLEASQVLADATVTASKAPDLSAFVPVQGSLASTEAVKTAQVQGKFNVSNKCNSISSTLSSMGDAAMALLGGQLPCPITAGVPCVGSAPDANSLQGFNALVGDIGDLLKQCSPPPPSEDQISQMLQAPNTQIAMKTCSATCIVAQSKAIQAKVLCVQALSDAESAAAEAANTAFSNYVQKAKDAYQQLDNIGQDYQAKQQFASTKLEEITKAQGDLQAAVSAMPAEIADLENKQNLYKNTATGISKAVKIRKNALAMQCFSKDSNTQYTCAPNGPTVSPEDYLKCRFEQSQTLKNSSTSPSGKIQTSQTTRDQASGAENKLNGVLSAMDGAAPNQAEVPTDTKSVASFNNQSQMSTGDILNQFGSQLQQFVITNNKNNTSTNALTFVQQVMTYCNAKETAQVNDEVNNPNSTIGQLKAQQQSDKLIITQGFQTLVPKYNQTYAAAQSAITGTAQNLPSCKTTNGVSDQQAFSIQSGCLRAIQKYQNDLLNGTGTASTSNTTIPGAPAKGTEGPLTISCKGLNACKSTYETTMKTLSTGLATIKSTQAQAKQAAVSGADAEINNYAKTVVQPFDQQTRQAKAELDTYLSAMGLPTTNFPSRKSDSSTLKTDANGMPESQDLSKLIASRMSPPQLDTSNLGQATQGAMAASQQAQAMLGQLQNIISTMKNFPQKAAAARQACAAQQLQSVASSLSSVPSAQGCLNHDYCKDKGVQFQQDVNSIVNTFNKYNITSVGMDSLNTGMQSACSPLTGSQADLIEKTRKERSDAAKATYPTEAAKVAALAELDKELKELREEERQVQRDAQMQGINGPAACTQFFGSIQRAKSSAVGIDRQAQGRSRGFSGQ